MIVMLRKAGANWVEGPDRFFDRETEIEALAERVRDGTHTLLTAAQRRMGKTILVRELLRRLHVEGNFETVFVDLEDAADASDAVAAIGAIGAEAKSASRALCRIGTVFAYALQGVGKAIDALSVADVRVKLHSGVDAGNWRQKGDGVFAALAEGDRPGGVGDRQTADPCPPTSHAGGGEDGGGCVVELAAPERPDPPRPRHPSLTPPRYESWYCVDRSTHYGRARGYPCD